MHTISLIRRQFWGLGQKDKKIGREGMSNEGERVEAGTYNSDFGTQLYFTLSSPVPLASQSNIGPHNQSLIKCFI